MKFICYACRQTVVALEGAWFIKDGYQCNMLNCPLCGTVNTLRIKVGTL